MARNLTTVAHVASAIETIAPLCLAEEWDNVGLLAGDAEAPCRRIMFCIDLTADVLAEARRARAEMVMAYHPPIFKPIPRVTRQATPVLYEALQSGIAIYSVHTAYDSALGGANDALADAMGMSQDRCPLQPRAAQGPYKITVFVPPPEVEKVAAAAFAAGAGNIGQYSQCGFAAEGVGTFFGEEGARPAVGQVHRREQVEEARWEAVCPPGKLADVLHAIRAAHSYEEPAIDVVRLAVPTESAAAGLGIGRIGSLSRPASLAQMVQRVQEACGVKAVQLARPARRRTIRKLAVGCGSCGSLFRLAMSAGVDLYVTGELRHHDALAASQAGVAVICVGHSNSERLTLAGLADKLRRRLPGLRVSLSRVDRDPFTVV